MHGTDFPVVSILPRRIVLVLAALLAVFLVVCVAGCGGATTSTSTQPTATASSSTGQSGPTQGTAATNAPASGGGWSGATYTVGNLELTAEPPAVDPDPQVATPGFKVVTVQVTARNVGSDIAGFNAGEFKLVDNQGKEHSDFGMTKKQKLSAGVLQPGTTATGYLSFELTNEAQPASLIYRSMGGKGEATWK